MSDTTFADLDAIFPAYGQDRAELDDDGEYLALFVIEVEQITYQDEMTGRGDRQKFGQTLYNAENQGLEEQKPVHALIQEAVWRRISMNERGQVPRFTGDGLIQKSLSRAYPAFLYVITDYYFKIIARIAA